MNFMSTADGVRIWRNVLQMARQGRIRAVVGKEIEFDNVPRALEAIERRETTGRTVVHVPRNTAN
jgi:D-arabinose 1-dehydrogenase-like Zn-dependent alcohol dehydrogenase